MKTKTDKVLHPRLARIAPLTASICWIFAFVNVFIGFALFFIYAPLVPIAIIGTFFSLQIWGVVFTIIGLLGAIALILNNWNFIRRMLVVGLLVKLIWLIALIIRCLQEPSATILFTGIWIFFALVQAVTFLFFLPELTIGRDNEQQ